MTESEKIFAVHNLKVAARYLNRALHIAPDPGLIRVLTTLYDETARIEDSPVEPEEQNAPRRRP